MDMKTRRLVALVEILLIIPAALFLASVVARHLSVLQPEPAGTAQQIVAWYSARMWTLWVLLIGLPLAALLTGSATLLNPGGGLARARETTARLSSAARDVRLPTRIIAGTTVASGLILAVVVLHTLAN